MHARHAKSAPSPVRVAAKFQNKKKVKSQDGGETTIYEYGPRQVANRHKEKAERIQKFMPKLPDLRAAYKKGLGDKDPMKRLTALAVGLIDHTYERVGNVDSAEDNGHYGVTVWEVRHVKFKGDKAEISYTGKSGVKHNKTVSDAKLVSALKDATKGKKPEDRVLCDGDECVVNADDVNEYLEPYGITAKDLRGLHANDEVRAALKKIRSEGPELPRARKEKDKILKDEFKKAIEQAAEAVGHEASTLRSQYLAPVIEESYLHDGTVADRLDKKAGATVLVGGDDESKAWVQGFFRRHPKLARYSKVKVNRVFGVSGSSSHPEASVKLGVIHLYPKFWDLSPDIKDFVFAHEIGHAVNGDFSLVGAAEIVGGVDLWGDAEPLPFAQHNMGEAFADSFASYFIDGDVQRRYPAWARLVEYALATIKTATLEESEKEEREDKRLIQKDPKFKPPRQDLRRRDVEDRDTRGDDDSDEKQDKKDRSKNYKDASLIKRIVTRHLAVRVARQKGKKSEEEDNRVKFLEQYGTKKVKNPVTDREVLLTTLASKTNPGEEKEYEVYEKEYQKWLESQKEKKKPSEEKPSEEKPAKPESESSPDSEEPKESKDPSPLLGALADSFATGKSKKIEEARKALLAEHPELSSEVKKHFDDYYAASKKLAEAAKLEPKAAVAAADKAEAEMKKSIESIRNIGKSEPEPAPESSPAPAPTAPTPKPAPTESPESKFNKSFDAFKKSLGYESRAIVDSFEDANALTEKVSKEFASINESLKDADEKQLVEEFSVARKQIEDMADDENIDPEKAIRALSVLMLEQQKLGNKTPKVIERQTEKSFGDFTDADDYRSVNSFLRSLPPFSQEIFNRKLKDSLAPASQESVDGLSDPSKGKVFAKKVEEAKAYFSSEAAKKRESTNPEEAAKHAAVLAANHKNNDPMVRFSISEDRAASIGSPEEQAREDDKFAKSKYRELVKSKMSAEEAKGHADRLYAKITSLPEGSVAHAKASAAYNAIKIYQITQTSPDDKVEGISPYVANAIRAAHRMGLAQDFLDTSSDVGKTDAQKLQNLTSKAAAAYSNLTDEELAEFLPEKDPLKGIATSAFESYSAPAARKFIRDEVINALVGQFRFSELEGSSFNPELDQAKSELHDDLDKITSKKKWFDDSKNLKAVRARIEAFNKLMADLWDKAKEYTKSVSMGTKLRREARAQSSRVASRYIENSGRYFIRDSY
jgi:DNA topoisomerase IB